MYLTDSIYNTKNLSKPLFISYIKLECTYDTFEHTYVSSVILSC